MSAMSVFKWSEEGLQSRRKIESKASGPCRRPCQCANRVRRVVVGERLKGTRVQQRHGWPSTQVMKAQYEPGTFCVTK